VPDEVRHFEWLIEERLRPYADIMYPEDIKLNYQIKEVNSRKYIIGKIGTALHLALFCNGGKRFSVLVDRIVTPGSLSYFAALDGLYENSASYVEHLTNGTQYEAERVADQLLFNLYK
jgi:capsular polysaccharide biosynthesis protein